MHASRPASWVSAALSAHIHPSAISGRAARPAELAALTSDLRQIVYNFEISIEGEESRAQISDLAYANYPLAARILRVRRDNLLATISTLENYSANNA